MKQRDGSTTETLIRAREYRHCTFSSRERENSAPTETRVDTNMTVSSSDIAGYRMANYYSGGCSAFVTDRERERESLGASQSIRTYVSESGLFLNKMQPFNRVRAETRVRTRLNNLAKLL